MSERYIVYADVVTIYDIVFADVSRNHIFAPKIAG